MIRGQDDEEREDILWKRWARLQRLNAECAGELQEVQIRRREFNDADGAMANLLDTQLEAPARWYVRPIMTEGPRTVTWQGHTCRLGPMVLYQLMARLTQNPGDCVTFDELRSDAWKRRVSDEAIRKAVQRLKERLIDARMGDLAKAIQSDTLSYYLDLNGRS